MTEDEWRNKGGCVDAVDPQIARGVARVPVVIPTYQQDLDRGCQTPPAPQLGQRVRCDPARLGVEEISQRYHPAGPGPSQRAVQTSEIIAGGADRDRDANGPKGR